MASAAPAPASSASGGAGGGAGAGGDDAAAAVNEPMKAGLRGLVEAIEASVYAKERWPLIVDPTGQAGRFLKYQMGAYLMANLAPDMVAEVEQQCGCGRHASHTLNCGLCW